MENDHLYVLSGVGTLGVGLFSEETFLANGVPVPHTIAALLAFVIGGATAAATYKITKSPFRYLSAILGITTLVASVLFLTTIESGALGLGVGGLERMIGLSNINVDCQLRRLPNRQSTRKVDTTLGNIKIVSNGKIYVRSSQLVIMEVKENSLLIKKVNDNTFDEFLGLINKLADFEQLDPPDEEAKRRLRIDCLSNKPRYEAIIGKIGDKSVSYVIYFFTYSSFLALPTLFLEDIFVLEEYRGQGIGKKMFDFCKEIARQNGCGRIEFTVLKWNTSAQRFYEKNKAKRLEWYLYRLDKEDF